jgi:hypothetical protein
MTGDSKGALVAAAAYAVLWFTTRRPCGCRGCRPRPTPTDQAARPRVELTRPASRSLVRRQGDPDGP